MIAVRIATGAPAVEKFSEARAKSFVELARRANVRNRYISDDTGSYGSARHLRSLGRYLNWLALRSGQGHDDTGFDRFETSARVPSK